MPLQNRVTPSGEIIADPSRGTLMGTRGILHDGERRLGQARWRHPHWVACGLEFKGRKQILMKPGAYTQLFFLDEAVALAAGHRPCAECRRAAYTSFVESWMRAHGGERLRSTGRATRPASCAERVTGSASRPSSMPPRRQLRPASCRGRGLPRPDHRLLPYDPAGYGKPRPRTSGLTAELLTPEPTVAALRAGYCPELHPFERRLAAGPASHPGDGNRPPPPRSQP